MLTLTAAQPVRLESSLALRFLLLTLALLAWEASGLDRVLAHLSGSAAGFALKEHWLLTTVLHDGMRRLGWLLVLLLAAAVWWPVGRGLRSMPLGRRWQLAATPLVATFVIALFKWFNASSCPWDLLEFGGVAHYVPHWAFWLAADGGGGHCFPAGHAASGFAFVGSYFALRPAHPRAAKAALAAAVAVGLVLGIAQQLRGAHFMSHTLWSLWLCWVVAWLLDSAPVIWRLARHVLPADWMRRNFFFN